MIIQDETKILPNMYWYYGQQDMKAMGPVLENENLYLTWVSNFSCAPDSFMLHYVRWMSGRKPYLVLEIDSHTADAGLDTRIEAFLDVVESYRRLGLGLGKRIGKRRYRIEPKKEFADIVDTKTGERIDFRDPRVTTIIPSLGELPAEMVAAAARKSGINAIFLPNPDSRTGPLARSVASGKECIPSLLLLGSVLQYLETHPPNQPDEYLAFFVPSTTGPCRTGQYYVFYEQLFEELGYENVICLVCDSDNSYRELGPAFSRGLWWALTIADYFTDVRLGLRLCASDANSAMALFGRHFQRIVRGMERGTKHLESALESAGNAFAAVPRKATLDQFRKVLIVGEIYVRRDTFSIREVSDYLISKGIYPKVTDITEWVRYTDHYRKANLDSQGRRERMFESVKSGLYKEKAVYHAEKLFKDMVEHKVARHVMPTGLVVRAPHDMDEIMKNAESEFIDQALESESTISSGVAATAMLDGFDGVVIIAPFACLPGRLLEGVYSPWARERGYPVLTLENDGQPYPPSTLARIEIFAHNVLRFKK